MAVSFVTEHVEDPDTSNTSTYQLGGAFTPGANSLLICILAATDTAATFSPTLSESGMDLTWVPIADSQWDNGTVFADFRVFYALVGGSPSSTTVTATYSEAVTGCIGWIGEFSGHDATTPIKAGQLTDAAQAAGVETMSLPSAPDADSMVVYANQIFRNPPAWDASGDSWTEDCDNGHATPANGLFVAHKANDQSIAFTGTNGTSWGIMFEIDAAAAGTNITAATLTVTPEQPAARIDHRLTAATLSATPTLPTARVDLRITAATLTASPTLPAAAITIPVAAATLTVTPSLPAARVDHQLPAATLTVTPTLPQAAVTVPVYAATLTATPTLPAARVDHTLTAAVLTATPTLPQAAVVSSIGAATLTATPTLPQARIDQRLTAATLTATPTLPQAAITLPLAAAVLTATPTLPAARLDHTLTAALLIVTPTLPQAAVTTAGQVEAVTLLASPTLPTAMLRHDLAAALLTVAVELPVASVSEDLLPVEGPGIATRTKIYRKTMPPVPRFSSRRVDPRGPRFRPRGNA